MSILGYFVLMALVACGIWAAYTWIKPKSVFIGYLVITVLCIFGVVLTLKALGLLDTVKNAQVPDIGATRVERSVTCG